MTRDLGDSRPHDRVRDTPDGQGEPEFLRHRGRDERQPDPLADNPHEPGRLAGRCGRSVDAADADLALLLPAAQMLEQTAHRVEHARLAGAGSTRHQGEGPGREAKVHRLEEPPPVEADGRIRDDHGSFALGLMAAHGGETADLHRGPERNRPLNGLLEHGDEEGSEGTLTAQLARALHARNRLAQRRKRRPGNEQGPRDGPDRSTDRSTGEQGAQIDDDTDQPDEQNRGREGQRAERRIRDPPARDRAEQLDAHERSSEGNPRQLDNQEPVAGPAAEDHPVHNPKRHETDRDQGRGAQRDESAPRHQACGDVVSEPCV